MVQEIISIREGFVLNLSSEQLTITSQCMLGVSMIGRTSVLYFLQDPFSYKYYITENIQKFIAP